NCEGQATVTVTPPSGSTFPKGTTTVNVTATDPAGNTATCSFTVTVNDATFAQLTCPSDIVVNHDAGHCCATVNFSARETDNCPDAHVTCLPASGSCFPVGNSTVTCTATD